MELSNVPYNETNWIILEQQWFEFGAVNFQKKRGILVTIKYCYYIYIIQKIIIDMYIKKQCLFTFIRRQYFWGKLVRDSRKKVSERK